MSFILFGIQLTAVEIMPLETVWTASTLDLPPIGRYKTKSVDDDAFILIRDAGFALDNRLLWSETAKPNAFMQPLRLAGYSDATQTTGLTASIENPASMLLADELLAGDHQPRTIDGENQSSLASLQNDSHHQLENTEALVVVDENNSTGASTDLDLYFKPIPTSEYDEFWTLATVPFISPATTAGPAVTLYTSNFENSNSAILFEGMRTSSYNTDGNFIDVPDDDNYLQLTYQNSTEQFGYGVVDSISNELKFDTYDKYIFRIESSYVNDTNHDLSDFSLIWKVTAGIEDEPGSAFSIEKDFDLNNIGYATLEFTFEGLSNELTNELIYFRFEPILNFDGDDDIASDFNINLNFAELQALPEMSSFSFISGLVVLFLVMTRRSRYLGLPEKV
tara:strand:+ start:846 stop:2024 length:1179 start_codon:yes stop_codon:yes gene_type:complete